MKKIFFMSLFLVASCSSTEKMEPQNVGLGSDISSKNRHVLTVSNDFVEVYLGCDHLMSDESSIRHQRLYLRRVLMSKGGDENSAVRYIKGTEEGIKIKGSEVVETIKNCTRNNTKDFCASKCYDLVKDLRSELRTSSGNLE